MRDTCSMCHDEFGFVEILPATKHAHETLTRCPHNAHELLTIRRRVELERDERQRLSRPRPQTTNDDEWPF